MMTHPIVHRLRGGYQIASGVGVDILWVSTDGCEAGPCEQERGGG